MGLSQKQKDQWRGYVSDKLNEDWKATEEEAGFQWIEQVDEVGKIFLDKYLRPQCEYIGCWESEEAWGKANVNPNNKEE
tara:strand:+ start:166 stop:402 length:237 start_codon:yes stop_codon:yes gene_type:complete